MDNKDFGDMLGDYWDIAYNQGQKGATHDDEEGSAQDALSNLLAFYQGSLRYKKALIEIAERFEDKLKLHKEDCFAYQVSTKALEQDHNT